MKPTSAPATAPMPMPIGPHMLPIDAPVIAPVSTALPVLPLCQSCAIAMPPESAAMPAPAMPIALIPLPHAASGHDQVPCAAAIRPVHEGTDECVVPSYATY